MRCAPIASGAQARAEAELEQRVSLALWRMDTKLAPLIAEESRSAAFLLHAVHHGGDASIRKGGPSDEQVASPLLIGRNSNVLLNFNADDRGRIGPRRRRRRRS